MQSSNPWFRQIGARRYLGFISTLGIIPAAVMQTAKSVTGITNEMYGAYRDRFAADFDKDHDMMPISQQADDHSWKASDLTYMIPYADVLAPFKAGAQFINAGKNTDQAAIELYLAAVTKSLTTALEPFMKPSILAETMISI